MNIDTHYPSTVIVAHVIWNFSADSKPRSIVGEQKPLTFQLVILTICT